MLNQVVRSQQAIKNTGDILARKERQRRAICNTAAALVDEIPQAISRAVLSNPTAPNLKLPPSVRLRTQVVLKTSEFSGAHAKKSMAMSVILQLLTWGFQGLFWLIVWCFRALFWPLSLLRFLFSNSMSGDGRRGNVYVRGHRRSGSYVRPYYRSPPYSHPAPASPTGVELLVLASLPILLYPVVSLVVVYPFIAAMIGVGAVTLWVLWRRR